MSRVEHALSTVGGRRFVVLLGGMYVASAVGYPLTPLGGEETQGVVTVVGILTGIPGLVLLYGGFRLQASDIRPQLYTIVARWCLRCIGIVFGVLALTVAVSGVDNLVQNVLILTALGSAAGYGVGSHEARAKTRELELQETVEELQTANERLEQFAYAASHDLQEPLRMVSSYLQLLESRYADELDDEALEFIDFAVDGADRMRAMVDSLLEYSRVDTRGDPLERTDTRVVFDGVLADLQRQIEAMDATITVDELPTVAADPNLLSQVFRNLLTNALEFSGDEPPNVNVSAERIGGGWRFSVADDGIGIDPEYHERIFEVFERLHATDDPFEVGSGGIGLALCERIVERHGGEMWVESAPGDGTIFYFTLPDSASSRSTNSLTSSPTV